MIEQEKNLLINMLQQIISKVVAETMIIGVPQNPDKNFETLCLYASGFNFANASMKNSLQNMVNDLQKQEQETISK